MYKKIAGAGLCMLLTASLCSADPFADTTISVSESVSELDTEKAATVATTEDTATETAVESEKADETTATEENKSEEAKTTKYTVASGDFLISIASRLLGDSSRWKEIVELNKDKYPSLISNPNLIYIGWELTIPAKDGSTTTDTNTSTATTATVADAGSSSTTTTTASTSASTSTSTTTTATSSTTTASNNGGAIITKDSRVLHIGDSHSCGVYGKTIDGLMRDTGASVNTVAVAGSNPSYFMKGTTTKCGYYSKDENGNVTEPYWTTPMQTPLLQNLIDTYKPTVLCVSLGANMVGYGESTIRSMIESVCDKGKAAGCQIVWVGPPDSRIQDNAQVNNLYNILKSEIAKYDGVLVDSRQYTDYPASGGDGLHYSGTEGTAKAKTWANSVMNAIQGK